MIRTTRLKRSAACFMAVVLTALCFTVFLHSPQVNAEGEDDAKQTAEASQTAIEEYELSGRNVGVQMGTIGERELAPYEESSRSKVEHFYTSADAVKALDTGHICAENAGERPTLYIKMKSGNTLTITEMQ